MSGCDLEDSYEERLNDIDEFIQSEIGFAHSSVSEPSAGEGIHRLSPVCKSLISHVKEEESATCMSSAPEVVVEVQIKNLKHTYDKKTRKTNKGLEYCLEDSKVTVVIRASDAITSIRAYSQRCAEAAIRTHDTTGAVELDVNVLEGDESCRIVTVDLGSVYKTHRGDPVYWLEKADVLRRNKWELIIALEFSSGLKGTVKSWPFRVTTKARYKMAGNTPDFLNGGHTQRILQKFTWFDSHDVTYLSEWLDSNTSALNEEPLGQSAEDSRSQDPNCRVGSLAEAKILFQPNTVLNKRVVTAYYSHNQNVDYVVEQSETPGLLKLVRNQSVLVSALGKGSRRKREGKGENWWACGHCLFERRKKSTIKAHVMQGVCRKSVAVKMSSVSVGD